MNRAVGVAVRKPRLAATVLPHATEAAWRLCKWDSLDSLLQQTAKSPGADGDPATIGGKVDAADAESVTPASSYSQTANSYGFAVASCVSRLHALSSRQRHPAVIGGLASRVNAAAVSSSSAASVHALLAALGEGALYGGLDIGGKKGVTEAVNSMGNAAALWSALAPTPLLALAPIASPSLVRVSALSTGISPSDARASFNASIAVARADVMTSLAAASMESYSRAYPSLVRLHCLRELERAADLAQLPDAASRDHSVATWDLDARLALTSPSACVREAVLAPRHALFRIFDLKDREAGVWLDVARLARGAGNHVAASAALLRASALGSDVAPIQSAKLLYLQGHVHRALQQLEPVERDLDTVGERLQASCAAAQGQGEDRVQAAQRQCALEAKRTLYATRWMVESRLVPESTAVARFNTVCKLHPHWEKAWFSLGKFHDTLLKAGASACSSASVDQATLERRDAHVIGVVEAYCTSLIHGHVHIFEALPRVLTLMFDYGAACAGASAVAAAATADAPTRAAAQASFASLVKRTGMAGPQERTLEKIVKTIKEMRASSVI